MVKIPPANAGDTEDTSLIPALGRFPERGNDNPLQYSCLENPMDRGDLWAIYGPWGCKESDATQHTSTTDAFSVSLILSVFALYFFGGSIYMYIHTYIQIHTSMYIHI